MGIRSSLVDLAVATMAVRNTHGVLASIAETLGVDGSSDGHGGGERLVDGVDGVRASDGSMDGMANWSSISANWSSISSNGSSIGGHGSDGGSIGGNWGGMHKRCGTVEGGGGSRLSGVHTGLVGGDGGTVSKSIGNIVHSSHTSIGITQTVGADLHAWSALLLSEGAASCVVFVVTESIVTQTLETKREREQNDKQGDMSVEGHTSSERVTADEPVLTMPGTQFTEAIMATEKRMKNFIFNLFGCSVSMHKAKTSESE